GKLSEPDPGPGPRGDRFEQRVEATLRSHHGPKQIRLPTRHPEKEAISKAQGEPSGELGPLPADVDSHLRAFPEGPPPAVQPIPTQKHAVPGKSVPGLAQLGESVRIDNQLLANGPRTRAGAPRAGSLQSSRELPGRALSVHRGHPA